MIRRFGSKKTVSYAKVRPELLYDLCTFALMH